jgi:hypothetical protein
MTKEQLIQNFIERFTNYLDTSFKNTILESTDRNDLEFITSVDWNYAGTFFVNVSFHVNVSSILDTEGFVFGSGTYGTLSFRYNLEHKDLHARAIATGKVMNAANSQELAIEATTINHLESEEPGSIGGYIHFWAQGFRYIKGIAINLKDENVLHEQLEAYYPHLISYMDSQIQDMADAILAFIDYYQEGDIIPEA